MNEDLIGKKFTRLTVLANFTPKEGRPQVICVCDCGTFTHPLAKDLLNAHTKSCGCYRISRITKTGKSRTREYKTWADMIYRCTDEDHPQYSDYGGRGIEVCKQWLNSFETFYAHMGKRPDGKTLDRVDNEDGYYPNNCRWATPKEQANNRRKRQKVQEAVCL